MDRQIRHLGLVLMVLFAALFLQLNYVQVVEAHKLANDPRNGRIATRDFSRDRGSIQAADGAVLATSVPVDDAFKRLRQYPEHDLFAQVTGYFSFTYGTDGVERVYNDELTGRSVGIRKLPDVLAERVRTGNLTLTLTKSVQSVAKRSLGNRKGAVVALNPLDGSVLALWSWPSFDPNGFAAHDQNAVRQAWTAANADAAKPLLPRAYRERYFPGSTFKVVTASAVLEKAPDLLTKTYPTLSTLPLPQTAGQKLSNFGGERCGGQLPDLLRVSCNTGFAQVGLDLGATNLAQEATAFGFDARPPLDLPSVASSVFPPASSFAHDQPGLAKSAIGQQDVSATPLQMALVAAAVADGGVVMTPHVLQSIRDSEGTVVKEARPQPWTRALSPDNAAALRDMMIAVVQRGTATRAAIPGVQVAAKTGTAQTGTGLSHAWLVAFAPAAAPKVAVAVIVESQPGGDDNATGGRVAAPIAQAVMKAALGTP